MNGGRSVLTIKLDLNEATEEQLEKLPGVGRTSAKKITAFRPYVSVLDLSRVGLSNYTLRKITPLVTVRSEG
jgi:DNA uptake protein ComE-like DNA-binding protein